MDTLARACHNGTQQSDQHYHRTLSQPNPLRVQPHAQIRQSVTNPQCLSRITNTDDDQEPRRRHSSAQQSRRSKRGTPSTIPPPRTSLARCVPPETPSSESQTHPETSGPIQDRPRDISGSLSTRITSELEDPRRVSCVPPNPIP